MPEDPRGEPRQPQSVRRASSARFEARFEQLRDGYRGAARSASVGSRRCLRRRSSWSCCVASLALVPWVGEDFFPSVDSGQFKLHVRAPTGTRIEETASALRSRRAGASASVIPPNELGSIIDNIGLPYSGINLSYSELGADRLRRTPTSWCR